MKNRLKNWLAGLALFLISGIVTMVCPFVVFAEEVQAELDAQSTHKPTAHEIMWPVRHVSDEDVEMPAPFDWLYKEAKASGKFDLSWYLKELGVEYVKEVSGYKYFFFVEREDARFFLFKLDGDNEWQAIFSNDYERAVRIHLIMADKDVFRLMYYFASRGTVDAREFQDSGKEGLEYLPLSSMYSITVYDTEMPSIEDGAAELEKLEDHSIKKEVNFYNLH